MRSSVLLPQPDGPRIVTKSFSATSKSVACSASVSPCVERKRRETPRIERTFITPDPALSPQRGEGTFSLTPVCRMQGEGA